MMTKCEPVASELERRCPSCDEVARLVYAGEQHWPDEIAEKMGVPTTTHLYTCTRCNSTVTILDPDD